MSGSAHGRVKAVSVAQHMERVKAVSVAQRMENVKVVGLSG